MRQAAVLAVLSAMTLSYLGPAAGQDPVPFTPIATRAIATLSIPGFVDFLAPDDRAVWSTNEDRVEKLALDSPGPVAVVAVPAPCGAMAVAFGSLWVTAHDTKTVWVLRASK